MAAFPKFKLSHKLVAAFVLSSLGIIVILTVSTIFFSFRNFSEYLGNRILDSQSKLVVRLQNEYQQNRGWEHLKGNRDLWFEILEATAVFDGEKKKRGHELDPKRFPNPGHAPEVNHNGDPDPAFSPGPPGPEIPGMFQGMPPEIHEDGNIPPEIKDQMYRELERQFPEKFGEWQKNGQLPMIIRDMMKKRFRPGIHPMLGRFCLFDENHRPVAGMPESSTRSSTGASNGYVLKAIEINGKTAGWLGIKMDRIPSHPLDWDYLRQQSEILLITGVCVLLLSGLISYLLSRHLLKPVRELAEATRSLTSRNFETRIDVKSGDELGQLAADFNILASTLKKYEELRRQWLSDISHELRTPVSILRGEIEAILDGIRKFTPETAESLHTEIIRLGRLINDLHDISTAESGALSIISEPVKPLIILENTLMTFSRIIENRQTEVTYMAEKYRDIEVMADSDRLGQVFSNIIENSLKYTYQPGKLIIEASESGEGFLVIGFEDSAPSVPDDALPKLFDRLYRVDESRSRKNGGSGIGLAICRHIIELHGGSITASESSAGGIRIEIRLPLMNHENSGEIPEE